MIINSLRSNPIGCDVIGVSPSMGHVPESTDRSGREILIALWKGQSIVIISTVALLVAGSYVCKGFQN